MATNNDNVDVDGHLVSNAVLELLDPRAECASRSCRASPRRAAPPPR
jgi:hypothetical protein